MKLATLLSVTALVAVTGCQKQDPATETHTTAATDPTPVQPNVAPLPIVPNPQVGTAAATGISDDDKKFMNEAAQGGLLEVKLGQTAEQKGASPDVKQLGTHMAADHGKAYDELKQLASRKGLTLASQLDDKHQKKVDDLTKITTGTKFDKEYSDDMVQDHEDDVKLFEKAAKDAKDPDIRAWAEKTLPTLRNHLQMAKDAKAKTKS